MKRFTLFALLAAGLVGAALAESASAWERGVRRGILAGTASSSPGSYNANSDSTPNTDPNCWHGPYYHTEWGMPVALVVPPTAERQVHWGWGIGNTRITPIWSQYSLGYPVPPAPFGPAAIYPTPPQPTDLDQFGVYYIRGPW